MYFAPKKLENNPFKKTKSSKLENCSHEDKKYKLQGIKVHFYNQWLKNKWKVLCFKLSKPVSYDRRATFNKALKRVNDDTNIYLMCKTISKLKVAIDVLIQNNH
jgi:hypothetical protein